MTDTSTNTLSSHNTGKNLLSKTKTKKRNDNNDNPEKEN